MPVISLITDEIFSNFCCKSFKGRKVITDKYSRVFTFESIVKF